MKRIVFATLVFAPALAFAHHGWSEYDQTNTLTLEGRIDEMGYEHPHGYVKLAASNRRRRRGWTTAA